MPFSLCRPKPMKGTEVTKREHFIGERGLSSIASDSLLLLKAFHTGYWPQLGNSLGVRRGDAYFRRSVCEWWVSWEWEGKLRKAQHTGLEQVGKYKRFNVFIGLFLQRDLLRAIHHVLQRQVPFFVFSLLYIWKSFDMLTISTKEDQNFKQM